MNNILQQPYPTGPNQHAPVQQERVAVPQKNPDAFPMDHINPAVREAEKIVHDSYVRITQEPQVMPEIDMHAERVAIETIHHASRELAHARQQALQAFLFNGDEESSWDFYKH